jgi:hypothetical protein
MIFIDGFGIGPADPEVNPFMGGTAPVLEGWMADHSVSMDATMGVPGLPQSATGQTALLTGLNAAAQMGHHVQGFPGSRLCAMIQEHNIYDRLQARGYRATFANAYYLEAMPDRIARRRPSVTTVAAMKAFGTVWDGVAMRAGRAVYHDLTREALLERGYEGPVITPEEAARHLLGIARENDFTFFEYFESDQAGHRGTLEEARAVARKLDRFAAELGRGLELERELLVITSDHGNMEDMSSSLHTVNPVPFIALGAGSASLLRAVRSITDVTPALLGLFP